MFGFGGSRQAVKTLSPPEIHDLASRHAIHLVDVREAGEWAQARIPGAIHAPLSTLRQMVASLPQDKPIVFYCLSGARSAQAMHLAAAAGVATGGHMAGGVAAWRAHGLPLTR